MTEPDEEAKAKASAASAAVAEHPPRKSKASA
jgi:hypothetical protein